MNNPSLEDELREFYWRHIIKPNTAPIDDEEKESLIRDALRANAIDIATARAERAIRREKSGFLSTLTPPDELEQAIVGELENEIARKLDEELETVLVTPEFQRAIREGSVAPLKMLKGPLYSLEELDEELNR